MSSFEITELADEDDVGIFAQRSAERALEGTGVHTDLPLRDDALLVRVHELDRILDRDDVIGARPVDEVDQRAERRGLAGAGGARDEDESLVQLTEALHFGRDAHLLDRDDRRRNLAEDGGGSVAVLECVRPKASDAGNLVGVIGVVGFREFVPVALGHDRAEHQFERFGVERWMVHPLHFAVEAKNGRLATAQVQIGRVLRDDRAQEQVERRLGALASVEAADGVALCPDAVASRCSDRDGELCRYRRGRTRRWWTGHRKRRRRGGRLTLRRRNGLEVAGEPLTFASGIDGDAHAPTHTVACRVDGERALLGGIAEECGLPRIERRHRACRCNLPKQREDLWPGERCFRDGPRCPVDFEFSDVALVEAECGRALADHDGQQTIELGHGASARPRVGDMRGADEQQVVGGEEREEAQRIVVEEIDEAGTIRAQLGKDGPGA